MSKHSKKESKSPPYIYPSTSFPTPPRLYLSLSLPTPFIHISTPPPPSTPWTAAAVEKTPAPPPATAAPVSSSTPRPTLRTNQGSFPRPSTRASSPSPTATGAPKYTRSTSASGSAPSTPSPLPSAPTTSPPSASAAATSSPTSRPSRSASNPFDNTELEFLARHSKAEVINMLRKHTYADELRQGRLTFSTDNSSNNNNDKAATQPDGRGGASMSREHLFNKTVTPSDVGKLNRLVIQKQHVERHLPALRDGGRESVLVSFEDTADGKVWRFRYSYWNSSQSSKT